MNTKIYLFFALSLLPYVNNLCTEGNPEQITLSLARNGVAHALHVPPSSIQLSPDSLYYAISNSVSNETTMLLEISVGEESTTTIVGYVLPRSFFPVDEGLRQLPNESGDEEAI